MFGELGAVTQRMQAKRVATASAQSGQGATMLEIDKGSPLDLLSAFSLFIFVIPPLLL